MCWDGAECIASVGRQGRDVIVVGSLRRLCRLSNTVASYRFVADAANYVTFNLSDING